MKRMILAILIMVMFLALGEARADGAWVLWFRTNCLSDFKWERIEAFTSSESCKQAQRIECKMILAPIKGTDILNGCPSYVTFVYKNGTTCEMDWICLPESIDPRK
jgi:hypothetical protein